MTLTEIPNFLPLSETLWTGGQPNESQLSELAQVGVQTVINLALPISTNALPNEAGIITALGLEYIHIPVLWDEPKPADLEKFMAAMDAQAGRKVLVHCALNYRATAFTALWRVLRQGWEVEAAFEFQRRVWKLEDYPVWQAFVAEALARR